MRCFTCVRNDKSHISYGEFVCLKIVFVREIVFSLFVTHKLSTREFSYKQTLSVLIALTHSLSLSQRVAASMQMQTWWLLNDLWSPIWYIHEMRYSLPQASNGRCLNTPRHINTDKQLILLTDTMLSSSQSVAFTLANVTVYYDKHNILANNRELLVLAKLAKLAKYTNECEHK